MAKGMKINDLKQVYTNEREFDCLHMPKFGSAVVGNNNMQKIGRVLNETDKNLFVTTSGAVAKGRKQANYDHIYYCNLERLITSDQIDQILENYINGNQTFDQLPYSDRVKAIIKETDITTKSDYAAIGNPYLFSEWQECIPDKHIAQILLTHRGAFRNRIEGTLFQKQKLEQDVDVSMFLKNVENLYRQPPVTYLQRHPDKYKPTILMANNQDLLSDRELRIMQGIFGDNDQLHLHNAKFMLRIFEKLVLSFNTDANGVYDKNKETISTLYADELTDQLIQYLTDGNGKTKMGTGGMKEKLEAIRRFLLKYRHFGDLVIYILNGKDPSQLETVLNGGDAGTKIIPSANLTEL